MHNRDEKQTPNPRQRRRVKRVADVDYDRTADSPSSGGTSDEERVVCLLYTSDAADETLWV